jgi:hypothetical protein
MISFRFGHARLWEPETCAYMSLTGVSGDMRAINSNIKDVKFGSGLSLTSQTMNLSTVAGTAFVTNPLTDFRPYVGFKITLTAEGKTLVGWIKAAGTGETLGSELPATWLNNGCEVFTSSGADITEATNTSSYGMVGTNLLAADATRKLFKTTINTNIAIYFFYGSPQWAITSLELQPAGLHTHYNVITTTNFYVMLYSIGEGSTLTVSNFVSQQVLTPSTTGVTIVSTKGGTTYDWAADDGIDPNAASFTAVISAS